MPMPDTQNHVIPQPDVTTPPPVADAVQLPEARDRGRPLKFQSVEDLEVRINMYFDDCDKEYDTRKFTHGELYEEDGKKFCSKCFGRARSKGCILVSGEKKVRRPYTTTGLAVWLDTSRITNR